MNLLTEFSLHFSQVETTAFTKHNIDYSLCIACTVITFCRLKIWPLGSFVKNSTPPISLIQGHLLHLPHLKVPFCCCPKLVGSTVSEKWLRVSRSLSKGALQKLNWGFVEIYLLMASACKRMDRLARIFPIVSCSCVNSVIKRIV